LVALAQAARAVAGGPVTVGVATPGTVAAGGRMKNCNSTCLNGQALPADLAAALGQPVALANDANCLALSEAHDGAGAGAAVVFGVILGTGVGGGIVVHGRVLQGPNGLAGEWGHNPLPWLDDEAPRFDCYCGRRACIETLLSGPGLAREHQAVNGGAPLTAAAVAAAAAAGDAAAQATLERHAERLARALASVVNLLDPDVIVLAGGLSQLPDVAGRVAARMPPWVLAAGAAGTEPLATRIEVARHGDASGVRGAAWLGRAA
jgi:fructokinase